MFLSVWRFAIDGKRLVSKVENWAGTRCFYNRGGGRAGMIFRSMDSLHDG